MTEVESRRTYLLECDVKFFRLSGRTIVENRLPESTSVHWHGLQIPIETMASSGFTEEDKVLKLAANLEKGSEHLLAAAGLPNSSL